MLPPADVDHISCITYLINDLIFEQTLVAERSLPAGHQLREQIVDTLLSASVCSCEHPFWLCVVARLLDSGKQPKQSSFFFQLSHQGYGGRACCN